MSGIFGLVRKDAGPVDPAWLAQMEAAMATWARDGSARHRAGSAGLGLLLSYNTPESKGETGPYAEKALLITADVRLDNRADLIPLLAPEEKTVTDPALLLRAYRRWGESCVEHLLGAFAFAIWDGNERTLFCARDQMGCRPFFYYEGKQFLAFASDPQALLALAAVPARPDPEALVAHHMLDYRFFAERTLFQKIRRLPPAHTLCLEGRQSRHRRYWTLTPRLHLHLSRPEAYAELLREQIEEAVACRLRTAYPIGSHLSGGLDSAAVTVVAARLLRGENRAAVTAFSWSPPPADQGGPAPVAGDERELIAAVCDREELVCNYVRLEMSDVLEVLQSEQHSVPGTRFYCEPLVRRQAADAGIRTLLSGWGGDETVAFSGRGHLADLYRRGQWRQLARHVRGQVVHHGGSVPGLLKESVLTPLLPDRLLLLLGRQISPAEQAFLAAEGWTLTAAEWQVLQRKWMVTRVRPGVHRNQMAMLANNHLALRMEAWAIRGARLGIEYRYPLLDRRLVELCLQFPPGLYLQGGWKRWPLRQAMAGILPEAVCWNPSKREPVRQAAIAPVIAAAKAELAEAVQASTVSLADLAPIHPCELRLPQPATDGASGHDSWADGEETTGE